MGGRISTLMLAALERALAEIRAPHRQVPPVVVVLGAGSVGGAAGGLKAGDLRGAALAPQHSHRRHGRRAGLAVGEDVRRGEGLRRGPAEVLGTLLHGAAPRWRTCGGSKTPVGRAAGTNARFMALAEELGIEVSKDPASAGP